MKEVSQLLLDLKRRIFKPIYFLSGEEAYYIDVISNYIEQHALDEADKEFNQTVVYGKDTDLANATATAAITPVCITVKTVQP